MNPGLLWLVGWGAAACVMVGVWWVQRRWGNAGIVDVVWSYLVGILAIMFAWGSDGLPTRRIIVALLAAFWSIRLGTYLWIRVRSHKEDGRYAALKEQWGDQASRRMLIFFQYQAFGAALFALPMLIASRNGAELNWIDGLGIGVFAIATLGEALADQQLAAFKRELSNSGRVCDRGLWKYSRHPNYFFEWLHWWAYVALAWAAPHGWIAWLGPIAMFYFIVFVTGIPPTEKQSLLSRGEAYRDYQRRTSAFFPWFPRRASSES